MAVNSKSEEKEYDGERWRERCENDVKDLFSPLLHSMTRRAADSSVASGTVKNPGPHNDWQCSRKLCSQCTGQWFAPF